MLWHSCHEHGAVNVFPCPYLQLELLVSAGFNKFLAAAFDLDGTVRETYGSDYGEYFLQP